MREPSFFHIEPHVQTGAVLKPLGSSKEDLNFGTPGFGTALDHFPYERAAPSVGCDISGLSQLVLIGIPLWQRLDLKLGFNQQLMLVFDDIHSGCNLKTSIKGVFVFTLPFSDNSWTRTC